MLQTSARLLRLLTTLQGRRSWSGRELAERLEITDRTLRRDVDRLRSLGYPVQSTAGVAGGYSLGAGTALPPLMLDDDEGMAISIALQAAAPSGVARIEEAAQRALAKLDQLLPARAQKRLKALRGSIVRLGGHAGPTVELAAVSTLAAACAEQVAIAFEYRDQRGRSTQREVEPMQVVHMERRWYLAAWDRGREDFRTFRLDRVVLPIARKQAFTPRPVPDDDLTGYVRRSVTVAPYAHRVRVRLLAPLHEARARIPASYGLLSPVDDTTCRFETGGRSLEVVAAWVAMLGFEFVVEEPAELNERMRTMAQRLLRSSEA
jgi:predicted DNA-binding transcriptional regulator YafY